MKPYLLGLFMAVCCTAYAEDIIQAPDDFLQQAFSGQPPQATTLWLTGAVGDAAREVLGHAPNSLRVRYWRDALRSVWVLEDIGKESPITAGFIVENGQLLNAAVLIYRESRGGEIRFRSFLDQFSGSRLKDNNLDKRIDNVSSATLSVKAMKRMAALALLLDEHSS